MGASNFKTSFFLRWEPKLAAMEYWGKETQVRQSDRLHRWSSLTSSDVEIEKVAVEDGLDDSGHDGDQIDEAFKVITPDPIQQVQATVWAKRKEIVGSNRLSFARFGNHEKLGQNGHSF